MSKVKDLIIKLAEKNGKDISEVPGFDNIKFICNDLELESVEYAEFSTGKDEPFLTIDIVYAENGKNKKGTFVIVDVSKDENQIVYDVISMGGIKTNYLPNSHEILSAINQFGVVNFQSLIELAQESMQLGAKPGFEIIDLYKFSRRINVDLPVLTLVN